MEKTTFKKLTEPERMLFIAKVHHALWYNDNLYHQFKKILNNIDNALPHAEYFCSNQIEKINENESNT